MYVCADIVGEGLEGGATFVHFFIIKEELIYTGHSTDEKNAFQEFSKS